MEAVKSMATWWRCGKGLATTLRANREARPVLVSVGRTEVNLGEPTGSIIIERGEGYKMTMLGSGEA